VLDCGREEGVPIPIASGEVGVENIENRFQKTVLDSLEAEKLLPSTKRGN
jgi:hypothetical protein